MQDTPKNFVVDYQDESGDSPIFQWHCKAYDAEHAEMKFHESDSEGWTILRIRPVASKVATAATNCHSAR